MPEDVWHLTTLRAQGWSIARLQRRYGIGKTALYRYLAPAQPDAIDAQAAD